MKKTIIALLMAAALLVGCSSSAPEHVGPAENSPAPGHVGPAETTTIQIEGDPVVLNSGYGKYIEVPEDGREQIYITSQEEMDELAASPCTLSNCDIRISAGKYEVDPYIVFTGCDNVRVIGEEGTEIIGLESETAVIVTDACSNMEFDNLIVGHKEFGSCEGPVVLFNDSHDMKMNNCDLYGCGLYGIKADDSEAELNGVTIRDCADNIMRLTDSSVKGDDCLFINNAYFGDSYYAAYEGYGSAVLDLSNSDVVNNLNNSQAEGITVNYNNVNEDGNGWN